MDTLKTFVVQETEISVSIAQGIDHISNVL